MQVIKIENGLRHEQEEFNGTWNQISELAVKFFRSHAEATVIEHTIYKNGSMSIYVKNKNHTIIYGYKMTANGNSKPSNIKSG